MIDASVIIPSFNRRDVLKRCLESLFNQDYPKDRYEIIVVDDGSQDGTEKMVQCLSGLRFFRHPERLGQSKARNLGLREAKGEIIIFIDSDIIVPPYFISEHMKTHRRYKDVIVDGPAIYINSLDEINLWQKRLLAFLDLFGASFITSNTSCPKRLLLEAGGFDEDFGIGFGWEDRELGLRLSKMEIRRVKNRRAFAYHFREDDPSRILTKYRECGINAILFYKKHPSLKTWWMVGMRYLWYDHIIPSKRIHAYAEGLREGLERYKDL